MSIISKRKHNQHKKDTYQKDAVVIAEPVDDVVSSDDSRYFHCPTCGLVVQIGDESCRNCGTMFDSSGDTISNPAADKVRYFYRKHKAAVLVVAALLIGGTGVSKGIDIATQIMVPAVTGMPAVEAAETLEEAGFDSEDVYFYDENASLSESDIEKGEYEVVNQSYKEGSKVHSDDTIAIECKDLFKERSEAMASLRYEKLQDALKTAGKYDYSCSFTNIKKEDDFSKAYEDLTSAEKADYYVYDVKSLDNDNRTADLIVDNKKNIEHDILRIFIDTKEQHVSDAEDVAEALGVDLKCITFDNKDTSVDPSLVVLAIKKVDFPSRTVTLRTDTEQHIEDRKILPTLENKIPYKGLSDRYIKDTAVGDYDRTETADDDYDLNDGETAYYWVSDDGKYDVLKVVCKSGEVARVKKLNKKVYWKNDLPDFSADKDAYDRKVAEAEAAKKEAEAAAAAKQAEKEQMVWIPRTGSCYHSNEYCSNMKNPSQVSLSMAKRLGYRACSKCY